MKLTTAQGKMLQTIAAGSAPRGGGVFSTLNALEAKGLIEWIPVEGEAYSKLQITAAGYNAMGALLAP